jgi:hypothetical protein
MYFMKSIDFEIMTAIAEFYFMSAANNSIINKLKSGWIYW